MCLAIGVPFYSIVFPYSRQLTRIRIFAILSLQRTTLRAPPEQTEAVNTSTGTGGAWREATRAGGGGAARTVWTRTVRTAVPLRYTPRHRNSLSRARRPPLTHRTSQQHRTAGRQEPRVKPLGLWSHLQALPDQSQPGNGLRLEGHDTGGCVASLPLYRRPSHPPGVRAGGG